MKIFGIGLILIFISITHGFADNIWDADKDEKIGMPDIIFEFQVISGDRDNPGQGTAGYIWDADGDLKISLGDIIGGFQILGGMSIKTYLYYKDSDKDGYGNPNDKKQAFIQPAGYVTDNTDCNDSKASVNPGSSEACNQIDDNCNKEIDEGLPKSTYYRDYDGDGYGDANSPEQLCAKFDGYSIDNTDCDDTRPLVYPGAPEECDKPIDNTYVIHNCNWWELSDRWIMVMDYCYPP